MPLNGRSLTILSSYSLWVRYFSIVNIDCSTLHIGCISTYTATHLCRRTSDHTQNAIREVLRALPVFSRRVSACYQHQKKGNYQKRCHVMELCQSFDGWDKVFDKLLKGLEDKAAQVRWIQCYIVIILEWIFSKSRLRTTVRPMIESTPPSDDPSTGLSHFFPLSHPVFDVLFSPHAISICTTQRAADSSECLSSSKSTTWPRRSAGRACSWWWW